MSVPGIEKLVYKATGGDITIPGEKLATDIQPVIEKLIQSTARGVNRRTGNKRIDESVNYFDDDILSDLEADEGNLNDLEIYFLGNTSATPDHTIPSMELIAHERMNFDAEAEDEPGLQLDIYRTWNG
ncbi:hypothetical protein [Fodinibius sp. SL11]|uniref:hypothetical protein n=1 Tax=Fodinibius sp. SL11 TaxID=3425690 RepID=UPI003F885915